VATGTVRRPVPVITQQGVTRDLVMHSVRDVRIKAQLDEAMDERRTGEPNYRRRLVEVRADVPERPSSPIEPFGYTKSERTFLLTGGERPASQRAPLGRAPRQYRLTGGATTKRPNEQLRAAQRLHRTVLRLPDDELVALADAITEERARRQVQPD